MKMLEDSFENATITTKLYNDLDRWKIASLFTHSAMYVSGGLTTAAYSRLAVWTSATDVLYVRAASNSW